MASDTMSRRPPTLRRVRSDSRLATAVKEIGFLLSAALLYTLVRGLTSDRVDAAFRHAEDVISFEKTLGINVETDLQGLILDHEWAVDAANGFYIYGYWPVFVLTLVWLIARRPAAYPFYRNALLASGAFSLVIFAFYPLAPPRFLPWHGFVDTISLEAPTYREMNSPTFVNEYAAMPSLHFGWILLLGIAWVALSRVLVVRIIGATMPLLMFAAIVLTGNHYVVDALVGGGVVVAGIGVAVLIERTKRKRAVQAAIDDAHESSSPSPESDEDDGSPGGAIPSQRTPNLSRVR
ncbi:phosphatase PAP2 family protein [Jiangella sp. DSM 45060]|uniref:phosphatase PAP2 family protein n=1 Tax=Jiangella sp. DSM 45060 TaxID=1798224 RepID=UPI00087B3A8D|nr:phosphatase PAP2 family protein [Jiangella sp. DSM 45060]SDT70433.1 PAP2 superfamily protein [Jiangella sp. DSM 45060]